MSKNKTVAPSWRLWWAARARRVRLWLAAAIAPQPVVKAVSCNYRLIDSDGHMGLTKQLDELAQQGWRQLTMAKPGDRFLVLLERRTETLFNLQSGSIEQHPSDDEGCNS